MFQKVWFIEGKLPLKPGQTCEDVFERLAPLFHEKGTTFDTHHETLTFSKKDQAAQDKMSIFDSGVLRVDTDNTAPTLSYRMKSRALLACFIAPLIFLAFAQFASAVNMLHGEDGDAAESDADRRSTSVAEEEDEEEKVYALNPIDKFLGAPEPKQPDKDEDESADEADGRRSTGGDAGEPEDEEEEDDKKHNPIPAYVFAGIFSVIYIVGRVLEDWLIKRRFRRLLETEPSP
ncbi:MAG: hypothetical protein AAGL99_14350 [Pseudomonadota bacterium]